MLVVVIKKTLSKISLVEKTFQNHWTPNWKSDHKLKLDYCSIQSLSWTRFGMLSLLMLTNWFEVYQRPGTKCNNNSIEIESWVRKKRKLMRILKMQPVDCQE